MGKQAHIILFGNQKGGSGKSTAAMHLIVGLLRLGFRVASIDLDARQQSLTHYLENRSRELEKHGVWLPMPTHILMEPVALDDRKQRRQELEKRLRDQIDLLRGQFDFIVIDTPGADNLLSRVGHGMADTLVTPVNDSFLDLDLLVRLKNGSIGEARPSSYANLVMAQRKKRFQQLKSGMDWIILRNRIPTLRSKNNRNMARHLEDLSAQMGFRIVPGITERVIFRELFLNGLTVLDLAEETALETPLTMSQLAARQEARDLMKALWLPSIERKMGHSKILEKERSQST
ncbi:division plane positioning ATPase MipZ [Aestuariispira insulae]|uniref:division plane positioning ATPase MipZ n=1 Tax=Aestuariispira insulae TaxID=1461337 RepID=UPI001C3F5926|nr:division plane positioning ATPase MipZ [Aestuariispira insulae]